MTDWNCSTFFVVCRVSVVLLVTGKRSKSLQGPFLTGARFFTSERSEAPDGKGVTFEAVFGGNDRCAIPAFKFLERIAGRGLETGQARLQ